MSDLQRPAGSPAIMGIINVTPDSFSDGGAFRTHDDAIQAGVQMALEGASIIDIGGESTRPPGQDYGEGSHEVSLQDEIERTIPVVEGIVRECPEHLVSIDTMKSEVARRALEAGARMVNDVSGGSYDRSIWEVAAAADAHYVIMHGHDPAARRAPEKVDYRDVTSNVYSWLWNRTIEARNAGVSKIIIDPGVGFAKHAADSIRVLRELWRLQPIGLPIMIGLSRKSFIGRVLDGAGVDARLYGSIGGALAASMNGASILRVHDVCETVEAFKVFSLLRDR